MFDSFQTKEEFYLADNKEEQNYKQARDRTEIKRLVTVYSKKNFENVVPQRVLLFVFIPFYFNFFFYLCIFQEKVP